MGATLRYFFSEGVNEKKYEVHNLIVFSRKFKNRPETLYSLLTAKTWTNESWSAFHTVFWLFFSCWTFHFCNCWHLYLRLLKMCPNSFDSCGVRRSKMFFITYCTGYPRESIAQKVFGIGPHLDYRNRLFLKVSGQCFNGISEKVNFGSLDEVRFQICFVR